MSRFRPGGMGPGGGGTAQALEDDSTPFTVGDNIAGFGALGGRCDELGLWKSAAGGGGRLTAGQLADLYNGGVGVTHPFTGTP